jgi:asparagine synthase (glutamine-hydrolysing)
MCGIAGVFRLTRPPELADAVAVLRMLDAQVHRGPDDWGLLVPETLKTDSSVHLGFGSRGSDHVRTYSNTAQTAGAVLGTRRLSILDLSTRGRMPMGSSDGRVWITYNGEAYNYQELRAQLGGVFDSETDTETILRGYETWGEGVLAHLSGMYACAIFETGPPARVVLARDRFGIKPLYYYRDGERLVFASEVRALLRSGLVPAETNPEALIRFLQVGSVPVPQTTIEGIRALPGGHYLIADQRGAFSRKYWDLPSHLSRSPDVLSLSRDDAIATTRALLEKAVDRHLVSDVQLGVFLSGGIDSSALVALAGRGGKRRLTTLSVNFEETEWSEARYARLVADRFRTDHREVVLRGEDLLGALPRIFSAMDEPSVDGVNAYFISQAAKSAGLTVVLSGAGGDEVFLGYGHFRKAALAESVSHALRSLPGWVRRRVVATAACAARWTGQLGADRVGYLDQPTAEHAYLLFRGLFSPREIAELLGIEERELQVLGPLFPATPDFSHRSLLDSFTLFEFQHYLQNQLLKDMDVMSMTHSVEVRVPYLDHRLVEHVMGLPSQFKLDGRRPKALLVDALGGDLPREVWDRPKMGFTLPFDPWLRRSAAELELCCLETKVLQRDAVRNLWRRFRAGRLHWSRAWALVVLSRFEAGRQQRLAA